MLKNLKMVSDRMFDKEKEVYKESVVCRNCCYEGTAHIERGTKVHDGECPRCSCRTLKRKVDYVHIRRSAFHHKDEVINLMMSIINERGLYEFMNNYKDFILENENER
ncbi:hypothetical protein AKJ51_04195 [candidate division MSBL1 archaeon SCGC-AAA382A20]|uniref:Uncharacterized protein n=1 Tax=candidate division MSBL1 archaeon SCGC-AAA382A20 TaxID=1698280 RepID=A0A133VI41_9EURY|nr:hypothetical protein AKJ51_04195 [candidate division MSBL1 archaeon SCGC-AAA382A20]